ncbi:MAG: tRNA dihydrouridine(20/20a) synthase DusA [Fibrobacter sp.]|jgi:tRNA-dihydrouridine synthase A|nr:tRNA dihydrouridine(20/20a) synthase DusA [Fibrobacter sp.]
MEDLHFYRRLSIAPMLDYTDRHERYFLRMLSRNILLYSEMITAPALLHGEPERFLRHHPAEHPVALQLGGSHPQNLALCAKMGEDAGYSEINLNCGCPSDRVQSGSFGACLMKEAALVGECISAMQAAVKIPVTIKTRIGIDHDDSWEFFLDFIETTGRAGCDTYIIHARKAWLKGLSPKENREVPPLNYEFVFRLKALKPHLNISINGGVRTLAQTKELLQKLDGVMIGREAYENPWMLREADAEIYGKENPGWKTRKQLLEAFFPYVEEQLKDGCPLNIITRHLFGLFNGLPGARTYRRILSEKASKAGADLRVLKEAMNAVEEQVL